MDKGKVFPDGAEDSLLHRFDRINPVLQGLSRGVMESRSQISQSTVLSENWGDCHSQSLLFRNDIEQREELPGKAAGGRRFA
jgi:hypothetical protein